TARDDTWSLARRQRRGRGPGRRSSEGDGRRRARLRACGRTRMPARRRARRPVDESSPLRPVEQLLRGLRARRVSVLVDDANRENEGDLCMAAEAVTPEAINFMVGFGRGLICVALDGQRCDELELTPQSDVNDALHGTAFTVSVDAREGVTTG